MKCIKPGLFTTVQDIGRTKYEKDGFSVAGVMSQYLYNIANALVDNDDGAVLEITMNGPVLQFNASNIIAFVAQDAEIFLDEQQIPVNTAVYVEKGQILKIQTIKSGARGYLAFHKSLKIKHILESASTHTRSGIGGYNGRTLKRNDVFYFNEKALNHDIIGNTFNIKSIEDPHTIPIIKGLQFDQFDTASHQLLVNQIYSISEMSDRMGYRLNGNKNLVHLENADIISEPIAPGSVQVPNNGQPIILLNDRQTIGGYTKIATVSFAGREKLAQLKAHDHIEFKWVSVEEATKDYKDYIHQMNQDIKSIKLNKYKDLSNIRPKSKKIAKLIKGE
ncbi:MULTISPECIES: biotin-dependent carboxyltransferase family protein [Mammaliicoccus]|uniref:Biotin-dependent carboxyltransferase family protein n=1 Tax=Mammaliicoccus fleurettii TaxID=150056 RepID=A0ABS5MM85_9STAP|nr:MULTISPECIES: biotin-dependent carboxyltransferase family protein [Mammaliicoccus]HCN61429.1 allophanate hydrolase subunit 2 family protein [Staphylococcus sp.]MBL0846274.1 biotin-dependent carboxyltransferase family protein [Mammaliicoccus fleurettii]MBS3671125.1 biotin-dependent carboxyltransferase family protein [Mammaliicoccus fleurettii]MBS3696501.1 biotin-dependent carboxyltransferase family protein [Mammaliicoccus fleurettii]MBW0764179.1 biotin-dependent carboxyltransferase family pr